MLQLLARLIYYLRRPKIIVISGTSGKTQTISLLHHILKDHFRIFKTKYHRSHFLGALLTFFDSSEPNFLYNIFKAFSLICKKNYPQLLLIEFGLERPALIKKYFSWLKIDVLVITSFGKIPAFVEYFAGPESMLLEYKQLISLLKPEGVLIINDDDLTLNELKSCWPRTLTFSLAHKADAFAKDIHFLCETKTYPVICGTKFSLVHKSTVYPLFLKFSLGKGIIYSTLASFLAAYHLGIKDTEIINDIEKYPGLSGRGIILKAKNGAFILDETAHASLGSLQYALEILKTVPLRKILVLGDLFKLGKFSYEAHSLIGKQAYFVDLFVTFGPRAKVAAESAIEMGLERDKLVSFFHFEHDRLVDFLSKNLKNGDFVLISGDRELGLYNVVESLR